MIIHENYAIVIYGQIYDDLLRSDVRSLYVIVLQYLKYNTVYTFYAIRLNYFWNRSQKVK